VEDLLTLSPVKKLDNDVPPIFLTQLQKYGEDGLVQKIYEDCIATPDELVGVENNLLDFSLSFFSMFRSKGEEEYFKLGCVLRRAAHMIYRFNLKYHKIPSNERFLNLIKK
jgi:hypothetical protein